MAEERPSQINGDRMMGEVVAVDTWHSQIGKGRSSRLHAHVAFKQSTFSTRGEFGKVTFTVHLTDARVE